MSSRHIPLGSQAVDDDGEGSSAPVDDDGAASSAARTDSPAELTEHLRIVTEAWESLFRAQVSVMRLLQADTAFSDLTMREYDVLFNLSRCPGGWLRLNDLNSHLLMSQPSLSRMVDRLEARQLLQRRQAPEDHRGVLIGLTEAGAERQKSIGRQHVRSIGRIVGGALSEAELQTLLELTSKLRTNVDPARVSPSPGDSAGGFR